MKRLLCLALSLSLLLAACGGEESAVSSAPPDYVPTDTVAQAVADYLGWTDLSPLEQEDRDFYLRELYGLEEGAWTEAAVYAAQGVDARELAIIRLSGEEQAEAVAAALEAYKESRVGDFYGYFPAQAALVEEGTIGQGQGYVFLFICDDPDKAVTAVHYALKGEEPPIWTTPEPTPSPEPTLTTTPEPMPEPTPTPESAPAVGRDDPGAPSTVTPAAAPEPDPEPTRTPKPLLDELNVVHFDPPNEYDMTLYDTSAILAAYASGDESGLDEKDAAILRVAARAIEDTVTEDMTDFEKELALRNWMLRRGSYDDTVYTGSRRGRADNTNPYGYLVSGYGICLGYATTFQLLMDLAGVECITVVGAAYHSTADHAWNMVKLEGEWYCVDTTWDPAGGYKYFNVTSDYMRETDHQWDYGAVPKATATRFCWDGEGDMPE